MIYALFASLSFIKKFVKGLFLWLHNIITVGLSMGIYGYIDLNV